MARPRCAWLTRSPVRAVTRACTLPPATAPNDMPTRMARGAPQATNTMLTTPMANPHVVTPQRLPSRSDAVPANGAATMLSSVLPAMSTPVSVATPMVKPADDNRSCTNNAMVAARTPAVTKRFIPCNDATTHRPRLARSRGLISSTGESLGLCRARRVSGSRINAATPPTAVTAAPIHIVAP